MPPVPLRPSCHHAVNCCTIDASTTEPPPGFTMSKSSFADSWNWIEKSCHCATAHSPNTPYTRQTDSRTEEMDVTNSKTAASHRRRELRSPTNGVQQSASSSSQTKPAMKTFASYSSRKPAR